MRARFIGAAGTKRWRRLRFFRLAAQDSRPTGLRRGSGDQSLVTAMPSARFVPALNELGRSASYGRLIGASLRPRAARREARAA